MPTKKQSSRIRAASQRAISSKLVKNMYAVKMPGIELEILAKLCRIGFDNSGKKRGQWSDITLLSFKNKYVKDFYKRMSILRKRRKRIYNKLSKLKGLIPNQR